MMRLRLLLIMMANISLIIKSLLIRKDHSPYYYTLPITGQPICTKTKIEEKNYHKGVTLNNYDGLKLKPLFYSEISSSFMIYEIFDKHKNIAKDFLKVFFDLDVDDDISITREKNYPRKGSIDILINFSINDRKSVNLIEVKVHDYLSVSPDQIRVYYEAALEELGNNNVYFAYLTQFNRNNIPSGTEIALPDSIREFEDSKKKLQVSDEKLRHVNWEEFHSFINSYKNSLSEELKLILELQNTWINAKSKDDIQLNKNTAGIRGLSDYFPDVDVDIIEELGFANNPEFKNNKEILSIDLSECTKIQLDKILSIIRQFSGSNNINKTLKLNTEETTMQAVKDFLKSLSESEDNWQLLSFYSSLFNFVNSTDHLLLYGTGVRGFSIKTNIKRKGIISMCTLWSSKKIDFSIKR